MQGKRSCAGPKTSCRGAPDSFYEGAPRCAGLMPPLERVSTIESGLRHPVKLRAWAPPARSYSRQCSRALPAQINQGQQKSTAVNTARVWPRRAGRLCVSFATFCGHTHRERRGAAAGVLPLHPCRLRAPATTLVRRGGATSEVCIGSQLSVLARLTVNIKYVCS